MRSPTENSLRHMREQGYYCEIVETWNPFARKRKDLLGIFDILCLKDGETVGVQTTTVSNVAARVKKINASATIAHARKAGWRCVVHGWRIVDGKYSLREVDVTEAPKSDPNSSV